MGREKRGKTGQDAKNKFNLKITRNKFNVSLYDLPNVAMSAFILCTAKCK